MTAPEPEPRPAFLTIPQPRLAETFAVRDYIAKLGQVAIDLTDDGVTLTLWSEEQARALIEAAGKAAAMFATLKMRDLIMDPTTHRLHFIEPAVTL